MFPLVQNLSCMKSHRGKSCSRGLTHNKSGKWDVKGQFPKVKTSYLFMMLLVQNVEYKALLPLSRSVQRIGWPSRSTRAVLFMKLRQAVWWPLIAETIRHFFWYFVIFSWAYPRDKEKHLETTWPWGCMVLVLYDCFLVFYRVFGFDGVCPWWLATTKCYTSDRVIRGLGISRFPLQVENTRPSKCSESPICLYVTQFDI